MKGENLNGGLEVMESENFLAEYKGFTCYAKIREHWKDKKIMKSLYVG